MNPKRVQLSRAKGWRKPEGAVFVARPSKWGNPFRVGVQEESLACFGRLTREEAVALFVLHIGPMGYFEYDEFKLAELRALAGRDFACWCPLDQPCHADVLLEVANS